VESLSVAFACLYSLLRVGLLVCVSLNGDVGSMDCATWARYGEKL